MKSLVHLHILHCIELYSQPAKADLTIAPSRENFEQMRADLMIAVGMLAAIEENKTEITGSNETPVIPKRS